MLQRIHLALFNVVIMDEDGDGVMMSPGCEMDALIIYDVIDDV